MSDFVNGVCKSDINELSINLMQDSVNLENAEIRYNPYSNKYEYTKEGFEEPSLELYATHDILTYYFGDNLDSVLSENKVYTITYNNIDTIIYGKNVIGYGVHDCEDAYTSGISDFIKEVLSDYISNKSDKYINIPDEIKDSVSAGVELWNNLEDLSDDNNMSPMEYAKAFANLLDLEGSFKGYYNGKVTDEYINKCGLIIERNHYSMIVSNNGIYDIDDLSDGSKHSIYKSYFDWCDIHKDDVVLYTENAMEIPLDEEKYRLMADDITNFAQKCNKPTLWDYLKISYDLLTNVNIKRIQKSVNIASATRYDPLILDLDGDSFNVEKKELGANFDLDKNGFAEKINWTSRYNFKRKRVVDMIL